MWPLEKAKEEVSISRAEASRLERHGNGHESRGITESTGTKPEVHTRGNWGQLGWPSVMGYSRAEPRAIGPLREVTITRKQVDASLSR